MIDGAPASNNILPFGLREASKTSCLPERREIEISTVPGTVIATRGRPYLRDSLTVHTAVGRTGKRCPTVPCQRARKGRARPASLLGAMAIEARLVPGFKREAGDLGTTTSLLGNPFKPHRR